ncbi:hypothetical protein CFP56_041618 [Quercus suber]|uniref:J domain-containing protein n=1 Tax=Quercus suber TaxID=58331 RepID=A0AAW0IV52_QUESU
MEQTTSLTEIKTEYQSLAKMYHSDAMIQQHHQDKTSRNRVGLQIRWQRFHRDSQHVRDALRSNGACALQPLLREHTSQFSNQRGPFGFSVEFSVKWVVSVL